MLITIGAAIELKSGPNIQLNMEACFKQIINEDNIAQFVVKKSCLPNYHIHLLLFLKKSKNLIYLS